MATTTTSSILRAPGTLVVDPLTAFASSAYPYGGTVMGLVSGFAVLPLGQSFIVWHEGRGEVGDILEADKQFAAVCLLRGWDDDVLGNVFKSPAYETGAVSGHRTLVEPAHDPGSSMLDHAHKFVFVPDNPKDVPAVLLYRAVPDWDEGARLSFSRKDELALPVRFTCVRDVSDRILRIGRLVDLPL